MSLTIVDKLLNVEGVFVRLALLEQENGRTLVHLRTATAGDAANVAENVLTVTADTGSELQWLSTSSGGTGTELHVTHVYEGDGFSEFEVGTRHNRERIHVAVHEVIRSD